MLLYDIFVALQGDTSNKVLSDAELTLLSQATITKEASQEAQQKIALAHSRLRFVLPNLSSGRVKMLQNAYGDFLAYCAGKLSQRPQVPVLPLVIEYLEENALSFKLSHTHMKMLYALFCFSLREQEDALSIARLGQAFMNTPKTFAAFLRYLMKSGVTVEEILSTHLIQNYFRYHIGLAGIEPIQTLHIFLAQAKRTKPLADALGRTCCSEPALAAYALDGTTQLDTSLNSPAYSEPRAIFTPSVQNFESLTHLFGIEFLKAALWRQFEEPTLESTKVSGALLNHPMILTTYFFEILHHTKDLDVLRKTFAQLLSPETLDGLVQARVNGLLTLLPYSPYLTQKIAHEDLESYLKGIKRTAATPFDLIADLAALFCLFRQQRSPQTMFLFETLIAELLESPNTLDDALIKEIRRFKPAKSYLTNLVGTLDSILDTYIAANTNYPIKAFDYISAEDLWAKLHLQISMLQEIEETPNHFPEDKYKFQAYLAHVFCEKETPETPFVLNQFLNTLGLDGVTVASQAEIYRLLRTLLISVDHPRLRLEIMQRLDSVNFNWRTVDAREGSLFIQAAMNGNLGFVEWLETNRVRSHEKISTIAVRAAELGHWHITQYLDSRYQLGRGPRHRLLALAAADRQPESLSWLLSSEKPKLCLGHIELAFKIAVLNNDLESVRVLLGSSRPPCDAVVVKGFKIARKNHFSEISEYITAKNHSALLKRAVSQVSEAEALDVRRTLKIRFSPLSKSHSFNALVQYGIFSPKSADLPDKETRPSLDRYRSI